jgi:predicted RNA-binding Zn-ribbon protein involved in translation (DUF1610 family)
MPGINEYKCNKCGFSMPGGWGGYMYVEDHEGNRILIGHPAEDCQVEEVLGPDYNNLELREKKVGYNSYCLCLWCHHQFEADLRDEVPSGWRSYYKCPSEETILNGIKKLVSVNEMCIPKDLWKKISKAWGKDERKCPSCGSDDVKTESELVGEICPICREGVIQEIDTGIKC